MNAGLLGGLTPSTERSASGTPDESKEFSQSGVQLAQLQCRVINMTTTCQLHDNPARAISTEYGRTFTNRHLVAEWTFADGVKITGRERAHSATYYRNRSERNTTDREIRAKGKVYVHVNVPFNVIEDLENRTRRPHSAWRKPLLEAMARIGIDAKMYWSQYAGCSCPCSPGYTIEGDDFRGWDFWVTLPGAPAVDEAKPARKIV